MIYVFGDSFSEDYKKMVGLNRMSSYMLPYTEYLGRDVKLYCNLLSEHLNQPLINNSIGGICNEHIFMLFMENYSKIKTDDIIVFGWTSLERFIVPILDENNEYVWRSNNITNNFLSEQTNYEVKYMMEQPLFKKKQLNLIKFIDEILPNNTTIHWTWSTILPEQSLTIKKETNGLVNDFHYGEEGHRYLFNKIKEQLEVTKRVRINLWDQVDWRKFNNDNTNNT
jgi:hypothetical protein